VRVGDVVEVISVLAADHKKFVGRRGRVISTAAGIRVRFDYKFSRKNGPLLVFNHSQLRVITVLDELAEI
jgi:hypothetical protein